MTAAPGQVWPQPQRSPHWAGQRTGHCWGLGPPPGRACRAPRPDSGSPRLHSPQPPPWHARPARPENNTARSVFLAFKPLVGKSVYSSVAAVEFLVDKQLALGHLVPFTSPRNGTPLDLSFQKCLVNGDY